MVNLKELRSLQHMTQENIAELLGMSRPQYSYMEKHNNIPPKYQRKLFTILKFNPDKVQLSGYDLYLFRSGLGLTRKSFSDALNISPSHYIKLEDMDIVPKKYSENILQKLNDERANSGIDATIKRIFGNHIVFETLDTLYIFSSSQDIFNEEPQLLIKNTTKQIVYAT